MNTTQRLGLFASLVFALIVLLLHFPFEGYTVQHNAIVRLGTGECPRLSMEELNKLTSEQLNRTFEQNRLCNPESEVQILPFQDWSSDAPLVPWFGSVLHTLIVMLSIVGLGTSWFFIFQTNPELTKVKTDAPAKDIETGL